jgi:hypothetical protein
MFCMKAHQLSIVLPSKSRLVQLRIYTSYTKTCVFLGVRGYFSRMTYFWSFVLFRFYWEIIFASNMTRQITFTSLNRKGNTTDMKIYNSRFLLIFFLNFNIYQAKIMLCMKAHQLSIVLPSKSRLVQLRIYTSYTKTCFFSLVLRVIFPEWLTFGHLYYSQSVWLIFVF